MKTLKLLAVLALGALAGAALTSGIAHAGRLPGEFVLFQALNGSPMTPGNITTATGADADSAAIAAGACIAIQCTTDTYVLEGTTVAATGATRGVLLLADAPPWQMCLSGAETKFSTLARSSAGTCGYWLMK